MKEQNIEKSLRIPSYERREAIVTALNEAVEIFTSHDEKTFEDLMKSGIQPIADAAEIDSVAVYRLLEEGSRLGQVYLWHSKTPTAKKKLLVLPDIPPVKRWLDILIKGGCINGNADDMPEDEAELAAMLGVKSIYLVPVFRHRKFWGVITLEDHTNCRYFKEEFLDLLRSAAHLCAGAVVRAEMEREIDEANEFTRAILDAAPIGFTLADENLQIFDCNDTMPALLGSTKQNYIDNFYMFSPEYQPDGLKSNDKALELMKKALNGDKQAYEWLHRSASGELIPFEITLTRTMYNGRYILQAYQYDLRNIKKMEKAVAEQSGLLKDALEKATVASRAKGEFLSNMSHEMRTPLNAIIGMTAIGKGAADMERKDYALNKIEDASTHLLGVINDILDISKIEANKFDLSPEEFNFEKMLQQVVNVVNFRVEEKHQKLTVHIDPSIPKTLIGDDQRIAQVITNLLGNAAKFTPEKGSISLETQLLREEKETKDSYCTIQISVSDTGIGISAEQQANLFQSFQQAESNTARKYGGTGLGLSISKSIVEMMGGSIWVSSEPGKGSIFAFTILAKRGEDKKQSLLGENINWNNIRIMVVDDDPDVLLHFKEIMQGFGLSCDTALNGEEALRLVGQNGSYNIYFVDWKMPSVDGIELTKALKTKVQGASKAVVIMISAAEWRGIEEEARKAGVDKFVSKPLFPSIIMDIIYETLGVGQQQEKGEAPEDIAGLFAGRRILLAEDVEINREIVLGLLAPTQLEIDCAENGAQAVQMFSEAPQKYDMILMDVHMPEMDGYEATRKIRKFEAEQRKKSGVNGSEAQAEVPIIAMTANVFREDVEKCLGAGMNSHIGKPLDFDNVLAKLRSNLLERQLWH